MANLREAFKLNKHDNWKNTNYEPIQYTNHCAYCNSSNVIAISYDGGSIKYCNSCKKKFKAIIIGSVDKLLCNIHNSNNCLKCGEKKCSMSPYMSE